MSKSNYLEAQLIAQIFNNVAPGFGSDTTYYLALHSADPGEAGTQATNEIAYTGYARAAISRNVSGFTVNAGNVVNAALVQFPNCTDNLGGTPTATHWSIGRSLSGAGDILYKGALNIPISISQTITPQFAASSLSITED